MRETISLGMLWVYQFLDRAAAFLLRHVFRYRLQVIRTNLSAAFTYASPRELEADVLAFYRYLARTFRQVLVRPHPGMLRKRIHFEPAPQLDRWLSEGKSVLLTFGHTGNWEWTVAYMSLLYPDRVCALYKKIKMPWANRLMFRKRKSYVPYLVDIRQPGTLVRLIQEKALLVMMVADQNPGSEPGLVWIPFLGQQTAFITGPESLATRYHLPVVYIRSLAREDGRYQLSCHTVFDGKESTPPGSITQRFAAALEENIKAQRATWLWSHKRWKRNPYFYPERKSTNIHG